MECIERKIVRVAEDGHCVVRATIVADEAPTAMPTTGEGITGMLATDTFASLSILIAVGAKKKYIADTNGEFKEWV